MAGVRGDTRRIPSFQGMNLPRLDTLIGPVPPPGWQAPASEPAGQGSEASADSCLRGNP